MSIIIKAVIGTIGGGIAGFILGFIISPPFGGPHCGTIGGMPFLAVCVFVGAIFGLVLSLLYWRDNHRIGIKF